MDVEGVDRAVLVAARLGASHASTNNSDNNDYLAVAVAAHPDRFAMFADVDSFWSTDYHTDRAAERLQREINATGARGVAHYSTGQDDGWFRSAAGRDFFELAEHLGLIASLHAPPAWYASIGDVAHANPKLQILLHHQGLAVADDEIGQLALLAECPNIYLKVSGFHYLTEQPWRYPFTAVMPRLQRLYATFGGGRLVWGSDFPVAKRYVSYRQTIEMVREECTFFGAGDLDLILGKTMEAILDKP